MKNEPVTAIERYSILTKPWQTTKDIARFIGCGTSKACAIMKEMHEQVVVSGKKPIKGHISRSIFHEYFNIEMSVITQEAKDYAKIQSIIENHNNAIET